MTDLPVPRPGRGRRRRRDRHLGRLPPDQARLDRRAAARAGHLSGGTTWHAAGLVGPLRASESGTRLVQYSAELYAALEAETGLATGYRNVGGVIVARTEDRMVAAAAHRGQRRGVRPGLRAAHARRGAGAAGR